MALVARPLVPRLRECSADLPTEPPTRAQLHPTGVPYALLRPPLAKLTNKCRNINLLSIVYAFRPQLRIRLTLGG